MKPCLPIAVKGDISILNEETGEYETQYGVSRQVANIKMEAFKRKYLSKNKKKKKKRR